jgi:hypothetical protein
MARGLRVLISNAGEDTGGVAIAIQRAFERYAPNWTVVAMRGQNNYIDYPQHLGWDRALFDELWDWADVIHTMENIDNLIEIRNPPGKPIVLHHHGQIYRQWSDHLNEVSAAHNLIQIGSTIDLETYGPTKWLPNPIDVVWMQAIRHQYKPPPGRSRVRFVHSPTAWRAAKGTDQWQAAVKAVGAELKLTEKASWTQALADKATGDVHLDQLLHGYGNSGLEAMGMGLPVVSGGLNEIESLIIKRAGILPYHPAMDRVPEAIAEIMDPAARKDVADRGWTYVNDFHAQEKVVARLKRIYTEARDRFKSDSGEPW